MQALSGRQRGAIRRDMDVETASAEDLRAYVYELESVIEAIREPAEAPVMLRAAFPNLTMQTAHLLAILSDGRVHTKDAILSRLYAGRADDPPEIKIIDVYLHKLRRAVAPHGVQIVTHWGAGMQIVAGLDVVRAAAETGALQPGSAVPAPPPKIGKNGGDRPAPYRMTATEAALRAIARRTSFRGGRPVSAVEITAREFSAEYATTTQFSSALRRNEELGYVGIVAVPVRTRRGATPWKVILTPNGAGRARELGFLSVEAA